MKKFIIILILLICPVFLASCNKEEEPGIILFSSNAIDQNFNFKKAEKSFVTGQRINFVALVPDPFTTTTARVQVLRSNMQQKVYLEMVQGRDIDVKLGKYYVINSFCVYDEGVYTIRLYTPDKPKVPRSVGIIEVTKP